MHAQTENETGKNKPQISLQQLKQLLQPSFSKHWLRICVGLTALLVVDFLQLVIPRIIKQGVDGLAAQTMSRELLASLGYQIVGIAILVVVLRFCWRYLIIGFSRLLEQAIRNRLFAHLLKLDSPFFERRTVGDLMAHLGNDLSAVQMACGMGMVAAIDAAIMSLAAIGFMVAIHPMLTVLALLPMPFLAISTRILSGKLHSRFNSVQEQFSALTEFSRSTLLSIGLIKAYTTEDFQTEHFGKLGRDYFRSNMRVAVIQGLISPLATMVGSTGMLMVLYFGGKLVIQSQITLGDFVAFITYLYMLIWPMMAIGWVANLVQRGRTSLARIHSLIASRPSLPELPWPGSDETANDLQHNPGFSLQNLTFSYPSQEHPSLSGIELELAPGIHGIAGRTGAGKSTLCKLLTRLYPVADNTLFFTDQDVNTLSTDYIRAHIGYVSQEPVLFSDTIANNIAFGVPDASREQIIEAARNAAIHDDIEKLPQSYETMIGERGVKLSGGQRQRLALARALLCDRPVLVIDDGLSAVDVATEHEVFNHLRTHFQGKTVVIVSNRIKLLSMTDRIIVLEDGMIQDIGGHSELLERNHFYQAMYEKQMKSSQQQSETDLPQELKEDAR